MIWWQPDPCVHQNRQYYGTIERRNDSGRLKLATTVEQTGYVRHWFSPIGRCEVCGSSSKRTALRKPGRGTHFYRRCCEVSIKGPALCEMWCCYCDFSRKVIRLALDTAEFQGIPACKGKEDDGGQDSSLHRHPIL
ncbi:uncharacterized protein LOC144111127 isoform X3 [Amblyomma americanum]